MILFSFDIFDTLITRDVDDPKMIFEIVENKLKAEDSTLPSDFCEDFSVIREQIELVTRAYYQKNDIYDITLDQIYKTLKCIYNLTSKQSKHIMELEIEAEYQSSIAITENIEYLKKLRKEGKRVVLISNMYLRELDIRHMLCKHDDVFNDITIYVSSESKKTKGTTTLYHYVKEQENVDFAEWLHIGDNKSLDVDIPSKLGIKCELYSDGIKYRGMKGKKARFDNHDIGVCSRENYKCNLKKSFDEINITDIDTPYKIGYQFAGPILYSYISWLIDLALRSEVEYLYFIARDGFVLKKIADEIISKNNYTIKTKYIYGSRKAWRLPAICPEEFDIKEFFRWNYPGRIYQFEQLADIFELSLSELKSIYSFIYSDVELAPGYINNLIEYMVEYESELAHLIEKKQGNKKNRVIEYLKHNIVPNHKCAFVDLVGSGYTQMCLSKLLRDAGIISQDEKITSYFYQLDSCEEFLGCKNIGYFSNRLPMSKTIEVLCGATHGQTNDYELRDGKWIPIMADDEGALLIEYGFEYMLAGIKDYASFNSNHLCSRKQVKRMWTDLADCRYSYMYDYLLDMPYSIRGNEKQVASYAPVLSNDDIRNLYYYHIYENINKYYCGHDLKLSLSRMKEEQLILKTDCDMKSQSIEGQLEIKKYIPTNFFKWDGKYSLLGDKIIIYGAGKRGKAVYERLTSGKDSLGRNYNKNIIAWADKNDVLVEEYNGPMIKPERINDYEYDQVVVAVAKKEMADEIMDELVQLGIKRSRMIWIR